MNDKIDTEALKREHPVVDVIGRYIALKRSGHTFVGRCPFHNDTGRPNLTIFPATETWHCFRCSEGGDVITFVEKIARVSFLDAAKMIGLSAQASGEALPQAKYPPRQWEKVVPPSPIIGDEHQRILQAAAEAYYFDLFSNTDAVDYLGRRKISLRTAHRHLVGFCEGDRLIPYLRYQRLPANKACDLGLLGNGREFFTGRLTIAEITPTGKVIHLTGRAYAHPNQEPKYLSTPNLKKPIYGWARAQGVKRAPILTESVTDFLTLSEWGYLPLSSLGTGLKEEHIATLRSLKHIAAVPHNDDAGWEAVFRWRSQLPNLLIIPLPQGVKDINELAQKEPQGREIFAAMLETWRANEPQRRLSSLAETWNAAQADPSRDGYPSRDVSKRAYWRAYSQSQGSEQSAYSLYLEAVQDLGSQVAPKEG